MTRPTLATIASTLVAGFVGYHLVRRRAFLRTLAWALTGHPADEADPTSCDGDLPRTGQEPWMVNGVLCNCEPRDFKHHPNCDTNLPPEKRSGPRIR